MKTAAKRVVQRFAEEMATRQIGTCGFCDRQQRVQQDKLVLHGYQRPGTGYTVGRCPGAKNPPFELSPITAQIGVDHYNYEVEYLKDKLASYKRDPLSILINVTRIDLATHKILPKMIPITEWAEAEYKGLDEERRKQYFQAKVETELKKVETEIRFNEGLLKEFKQKVDNWKLVPLTSFDEKVDQQREKKEEREKRIVETRMAKYVALKAKLLDRINSSFSKFKVDEAKFRRIEDPSGKLTSKNINLAKGLMDRHRSLVEMLTESPNKLREALDYKMPIQAIYKDLGVDEIYRHLGLLKGGQYLSEKESGIKTNHGSFYGYNSEWKPNWPGY